MTTVQWMRHGTCHDGLHRPAAHARPHSPLAAQGRTETTAAADRLRSSGVTPALIVPSPLPRALATAAILAALLDCAIADPDPIFTEWRAPDCVLGLGPNDYPPSYRDWKANRAAHPDIALNGGESLTAFATRARAAADHAQHLAQGHERVLIVSHRLLIGAIAAINTRSSDPAAVFAFATAFTLAPAHIWRPGQEGPQ